MAERKQVKVEDAQVIFRNFAGAAAKFNTEGKRNFCVVLDEDTAAAMLADGWNVKRLNPREEDENEVGNPYVKVNISYAFKPPLIVTLTDNSRTFMSEDMLETLDYADFETVDVIIDGSPYDVNDKTGISGYVKSMFITLREDDLERKYAHRLHPPAALSEYQQEPNE